MNSQVIYSVISFAYDLGLRVVNYKAAADYVVGQLPYKVNTSLSILDAGCGTGLYSLALLKRFPNARIVGFDINQEMLDSFRKILHRSGMEHRVTLCVGDILKEIPHGSARYDLIVTGGVLEFVDIYEAVKNLLPHLCRGGYFLNSPVKSTPLGRLVARLYGFKVYSAKVNADAFVLNGLTCIKTISLSSRFFPISLVKTAHFFRKM